VKNNHECRGSMFHSCVRCHGRHLACNTPGSASRSDRTAKENGTASKRKQMDEEENQEAAGERTTLSRTKSARSMAIDEDANGLIEEQQEIDSESNDEAGEEGASPVPRKSERLRNTASAKAATHDSSAIQEGSTALIEGTSTGVHLSRGRLPVMDRDEYHARLKNKDRVLAQLAKAQSNKIKV
jgi:hypothetical protein